MTRPLSIRKKTIASLHAIERYQQRIDPAANTPEARAAVIKIIQSGHLRKHVWWYPGKNCELFAHLDHPGVCVVVVDGVAVTVVARWARRASRAPQAEIQKERARHARLEPVAPFNARNQRQLTLAMGG